MMKFSCTMSSGSDIFYATVIAENAQQAREMAAAETKKGRPREWNVAVLEPEVLGPARFPRFRFARGLIFKSRRFEARGASPTGAFLGGVEVGSHSAPFDLATFGG